MNLTVCGFELAFSFEKGLERRLLQENLDYFKALPKKSAPDFRIEVLLVKGRPAGGFDFIKHNRTIVLCIRPEKIFFNNFLRHFLSTVLAENKGFLLHSSGIVSSGRAVIFSGRSGAGKTTLARRFSRILSDDIVAVRKKEGAYYAYPTPFWGGLAMTGRLMAQKEAKIRRFYFLKKADENRSGPLEKKRALKRLLRNILYFGKRPGDLLDTALDFIGSSDISELRYKKGFVPDV